MMIMIIIIMIMIENKKLIVNQYSYHGDLAVL